MSRTFAEYSPEEKLQVTAQRCRGQQERINELIMERDGWEELAWNLGNQLGRAARGKTFKREAAKLLKGSMFEIK